MRREVQDVNLRTRETEIEEQERGRDTWVDTDGIRSTSGDKRRKEGGGQERSGAARELGRSQMCGTWEWSQTFPFFFGQTLDSSIKNIPLFLCFISLGLKNILTFYP